MVSGYAATTAVVICRAIVSLHAIFAPARLYVASACRYVLSVFYTPRAQAVDVAELTELYDPACSVYQVQCTAV